MMKATVCHIIRGDKLLLKLASRGISKGKWNAPGGKIEPNETPIQNAIREVFEETGLKVSKLFYHGKLKFYLDGKNKLSVTSHLFSTTNFSGKIKASKEGKLKWFTKDKIPYDKMWCDDEYWFSLMLQKKKFNGSFYFNKTNKKILKYSISS